MFSTSGTSPGAVVQLQDPIQEGQWQQVPAPPVKRRVSQPLDFRRQLFALQADQFQKTGLGDNKPLLPNADDQARDDGERQAES